MTEAQSHPRVVGYVPPPGSSERTKLLRLRVLAGHNLAKKDIFGASDPYLRIDLVTIHGEEVEDSVLTKTKKRTLNPRWDEEFIFRVKPTDHKLVLEVFDENRLTRDDFLGMVELPLTSMPREAEGRTVPNKFYILRPRSAKSKVKGHLQLYHAYIPEPNSTPDEDTSVEELEGATNSSSGSGSNEDGWEIVAATEQPPAIRPLGAGPVMMGTEEQPAAVSAATAATDSAAAGQSATDPQQPVLPSGWEERQDANGRTYYVNHVARTTQWTRPELSANSGVGAGSLAAAAGGSSASAAPNAPGTGDGINPQRRVHISMDESASNTSLESMDRESGGSATAGNDAIIEIMHNLSTGGGPNPPPPATGARGERSSSLSTLDLSNGSDVADAGGATTAGAVPRRTSSSGPSAGGGMAANRHSNTAAKPLNTEGLPSDWTMQVAPNGRVFFINHKEKKTTWVDPRTGRPSPLPSHANPPNRRHEDDLGPLPEGWEERVHTDGRIFFIDHNTRITQWEDPRLSNPSIAGPAIPYNRDYKRKYDYLKSQLKKPSGVPNKIEIKVRRAHLLEDSYRQIMHFPSHKVDVLKTKLWIDFDSEVGLDYGGVAREWFYLLSKEMFNPYYGLFEYSATDNYTLQINPYSGVCNEDHLSYFKFIGRVAGMAVYHGKLLDGFFIRPFYKMMLDKSITLKDMESVDTEYYNSLLWIKENDPAELDLTFQVDEEQFGRTVTRELKANGANIRVSNENKDEYISRVIEWRFVSRVKDQMEHFKAGFADLVPLNCIKIFDEGELELLMCGIGSIDVKDWKANTVYKGDYHPTHIVVQWFWRVVLSFNNEMRSRLLQFVTGTSRVPMNGFKELYGSNGPQLFTIEKWGTPSNFPRAHTCFNRLDLPPYESYQQLRDRLIRAIEGSEGFAGVD